MEEKTEYQISASTNDGILEIVVTGKVTGYNVSQFQQEINAIRAAQGDRILLDIRPLVERSIDSFYHVRRPPHATGRTAVLDLPENEFMKIRCEDVAKYTSMELKWFSDAGTAKAWLKRG
jgi:hypothetical protein